MSSLILETMSRFLSSLLLLASIFLLWRGHNEPGGGFAGGLMAATAFVLTALAAGTDAARQSLRQPPERLIGAGIALAAVSALIGPAFGGAFFEGQWITLTVLNGQSVKLGTPLLFDLGVYLAVVGVSLAIMLSLLEEN